MNKTVNNLSKEKIHQLLAAMGSEPQEDDAQTEVVEYNWHEPQYFSRPELIKLDDFAQRIATAVAEKFSGFCHSKFNVTITSTRFHFASELLNQTLEGGCKEYRLPIETDSEHICGFIGMPDQTAVAWAKQLLGDCESEKELNKTLSQLEESLLLDLASSLVEAFPTPQGGAEFHPTENFLKDRWPLKVHGTEELCRISFETKKDGSENGVMAYVLIICEELNSIVGKTVRAGKKPSDEETSKAVLNYLKRMPVAVTAQLVSTELTFEEIATLEVDDVLLLDKRVDQPVDLIIDGRTVYYGWPVKSKGNYAISIASTAPESGT